MEAGSISFSRRRRLRGDTQPGRQVCRDIGTKSESNTSKKRPRPDRRPQYQGPGLRCWTWLSLMAITATTGFAPCLPRTLPCALLTLTTDTTDALLVDDAYREETNTAEPSAAIPHACFQDDDDRPETLGHDRKTKRTIDRAIFGVHAAVHHIDNGLDEPLTEASPMPTSVRALHAHRMPEDESTHDLQHILNSDPTDTLRCQDLSLDDTPDRSLPQRYQSLARLWKTRYNNSTVSSSWDIGLSKYQRSLLSRSLNTRQRFVTGPNPLTVSFQPSPTRSWFQQDVLEDLLINGTRSSLAYDTMDRRSWMDTAKADDNEDDHQYYTMEWLAVIRTNKHPGYVKLLHKRLWVTGGFSIRRQESLLLRVECATGSLKSLASSSLVWPNEVQAVPGTQRSVLVCDGFLVPGKDRGGLYLVRDDGTTTCLTRPTVPTRYRPMALNFFGIRPRPARAETVLDDDRWFYHRAVWVDLTGDGRQSILTARCKVSLDNMRDDIMSGITKQGELVWLECPVAPVVRDGVGYEDDGVTRFDPLRHAPWKTRVLASGPDVMFCVAQMDGNDDTSIQVLASEFFSQRITLHSIRKGPEPVVTFSRTIDEDCGKSFGCILADLEGQTDSVARVVDSGSTVSTLQRGDGFTHLLVTNHECAYDDAALEDENDSITSTLDGGSLFAYQVPTDTRDAWKTQPWKRSTIATGFKVQGKLGNMINPGAPGFCYTFYARPDDTGPPLIAVAGDCSESAYIFRPTRRNKFEYKLMVELQCGATVGSLAVGYEDFTSTEQDSGYAKLYIPCYEKDVIHVFALGSAMGEKVREDDDGLVTDESKP